MSRNRFLHSVVSILVAYTSFNSSGCWSGQQDIDYRETVCGFLGTAAPIIGAYIDVYQLDERTGELVSLYPIASTLTPTNADGEFCFNDVELSGALLFRARGGFVHEYWSPEPAQLGVRHLAATIEHWTGQRDLTITPWTTLAYELAAARRRNDEETTFYAAVLTSERLLYEHFIGGEVSSDSTNHCDSLLNCLRPAHFASISNIDVSPEAEHYLLTLLSLSALAAEWSGLSASTKDINSVTLTMNYLAHDAVDGRFDGFEIDQPLKTTVNTLRSEIGRAFAANGPVNTSYQYSDYSVTFERIAFNTDQRLFGAGAPESIDTGIPHIHVMPSPIVDERDDLIIFDSSRMPTHVHNTSSTIPLESVFEPGCPEIHKHVNLLNDTSAAANPLRWRFAVRDDVTGIAEVRTEVSAGSSFPRVSYADDIVVNEALPDGTYEVTVTVTAEDVPELLTQEGEFKIAIIVTDGAGNESIPLEGCWTHVPRAAPLWVGPLTSADAVESILNYSLEHDNLSPILNESFSSLNAPLLTSFEIFNPNKQVVYLAIALNDISGEFAWTWHYDYITGQREQTLDSCIKLGRCTSEPPQPGYHGTPLPNPTIPNDGVVLTTTDGQCGDECSTIPIIVEPGASITVHIRWSDFAIMLPNDVSPGELSELDDPVDGEGLATGTSRAYVHCLTENGDGTCSDRQYYEEHVTMRAARLDVRGVITGETFAAPSLAPRRPVGQKFTFGTDHSFAHSWITYED